MKRRFLIGNGHYSFWCATHGDPYIISCNRPKGTELTFSKAFNRKREDYLRLFWKYTEQGRLHEVTGIDRFSSHYTLLYDESPLQEAGDERMLRIDRICADITNASPHLRKGTMKDRIQTLLTIGEEIAEDFYYGLLENTLTPQEGMGEGMLLLNNRKEQLARITFTHAQVIELLAKQQQAQVR